MPDTVGKLEAYYKYRDISKSEEPEWQRLDTDECTEADQESRFFEYDGIVTKKAMERFQGTLLCISEEQESGLHIWGNSMTEFNRQFIIQLTLVNQSDKDLLLGKKLVLLYNERFLNLEESDSENDYLR